MTELTPPALRKAALEDAGVPPIFLQTLGDDAQPDDLKLVIGRPPDDLFDRAAPHYSILRQSVVTPVLECQGAIVALLDHDGERRFIHFELETDEVYEDFGANFQNVLAWLLISYYELSECSRKAFVRAGESLGATFSGPLRPT